MPPTIRASRNVQVFVTNDAEHEEAERGDQRAADEHRARAVAVEHDADGGGREAERHGGGREEVARFLRAEAEHDDGERRHEDEARLDDPRDHREAVRDAQVAMAEERDRDDRRFRAPLGEDEEVAEPEEGEEREKHRLRDEAAPEIVAPDLVQGAHQADEREGEVDRGREYRAGRACPAAHRAARACRATKTITASGRLMMKSQCHEACCVRTPPRFGPMIAAMPQSEPVTP